MYIYHGYSAEDNTVIVYLKTYDSEYGEYRRSENLKFLHLKSNDYIISLGSDSEYNLRLKSEFSCFNLRTED